MTTSFASRVPWRRPSIHGALWLVVSFGLLFFAKRSFDGWPPDFALRTPLGWAMWQTLRYAALFGTFVAWTAAIFFSVRAYEISKTSTEHKPLLPRFVLLATALS